MAMASPAAQPASGNTFTYVSTGSTSSSALASGSGTALTLTSAQLAAGITPGEAALAAAMLNPIAIRLVIKAGLAALKVASRATYNRIVAWVNSGKDLFIRNWNSLPQRFRDIVLGAAGGISTNALWDAIKWVLGVD